MGGEKGWREGGRGDGEGSRRREDDEIKGWRGDEEKALHLQGLTRAVWLSRRGLARAAVINRVAGVWAGCSPPATDPATL